MRTIGEKIYYCNYYSCFMKCVCPLAAMPGREASFDIILGMTPNPWVTLAIVALIFIGIAVGRYPVIKSNRTTIALLGVALLVLFRQVRFEDLPSYVNFDTIILLFSTMIINANLKLAGFFTLAGHTLARLARTPRVFLALEIVISGVLSAIFLNDTICLMFAPLILGLMDSLKRNPLPLLDRPGAGRQRGFDCDFDRQSAEHDRRASRRASPTWILPWRWPLLHCLGWA